MGYGYQYDPPGRRCSGGPTPGTVALSAMLRARWPALRDDGIYNCRPVVGGSALSFHGEGRAADLGTRDRALGDQVAAFLVANADALGVQEVIWYRRRWDSRTRSWAPYGGLGKDAHTSHVHVALCRAAAGALAPGAVGAAGAGAGDAGGDGASVLTEGRTWVRVASVAIGVVLVALALVLVARDVGGPAAGRVLEAAVPEVRAVRAAARA